MSPPHPPPLLPLPQTLLLPVGTFLSFATVSPLRCPIYIICVYYFRVIIHYTYTAPPFLISYWVFVIYLRPYLGVCWNWFIIGILWICICCRIIKSYPWVYTYKLNYIHTRLVNLFGYNNTLTVNCLLCQLPPLKPHSSSYYYQPFPWLISDPNKKMWICLSSKINFCMFN